MTTKEKHKKRTEEQKKEARELYNFHLKELHRRYLSNVENYDKALLTLSSSTLGFSLLAIRYIVPWETADLLGMLILAWFLMGISVITSLIAYRIGNEAINKEEKKATDYYLKGVEDALERENLYKKWNRWLNNATGLLFAISLFLILLFVSLNIVC